MITFLLLFLPLGNNWNCNGIIDTPTDTPLAHMCTHILIPGVNGTPLIKSSEILRYVIFTL